MIFFYELLNVVLGFQRLIILQSATKSLGGFTGKMFEQRFIMHAFGLLISFFGTRILLKWLGERICLILIPVITGLLLVYFMIAYDANAILVVFMGLGTLNYAFASPLRESLYIPTVKDIRFKSKAWIDSFGMKISKAAGSSFNEAAAVLVAGSTLFHTVYAIFFSTIIGLWILLAWWLGNKYYDAIKHNKVIGE
jgi:AAA family ATP:ADP antiporter